MGRLLLFLFLSLALLAYSPTARAAEPLGLVVFGDLPREELRSGLARSTGRPVELRDAASPGAAHVTVTWHRDRSELAVAYDEPGRGTVSRVVRARATPSQCAEDAIVLATSLVENEADELLGKPAPPPPPAPSPEAPPEPVPTPPPAPAPPPAPPPPARDVVIAYAALFHPLATNFDHAYATTRFGLDLLYGRAGELADGAQIGVVNVLAGKEGIATGDMSGVQLALGMNFASGHATGTQIALLGGNAAAEGLDGAQLAMLTNVAAGPMRGVQAAALNVAGDVQGAQIGLVNVGKKVQGVTLGVINVADDVEGVPIGLISVTRTGGIHPVLWGGSLDYANFGVQFATKHTYTMVAAHYTSIGSADYAPVGSRPALHLDERSFFGGGFFLGGHVPIDDAFVDFDLGFSGFGAPQESRSTKGVTYREVLLEPQLRVMGGWSFAEHASLFGGAAIVTRARIVENGEDAIVTVVPQVFGGIRF